MKQLHISPNIFIKGWEFGIYFRGADDPDGRYCTSLTFCFFSGMIHIGIKDIGK